MKRQHCVVFILLALSFALVVGCGKGSDESLDPADGDYVASVRFLLMEEGEERARVNQTKALALRQVGESAQLEFEEGEYEAKFHLLDAQKGKQALVVSLDSELMHCQTRIFVDNALDLPLLELNCKAEKLTAKVSVFNNSFWNQQGEGHDKDEQEKE